MKYRGVLYKKMDAKNAFKYYLIFFFQDLFGLIVASNFVTPH